MKLSSLSSLFVLKKMYRYYKMFFFFYIVTFFFFAIVSKVKYSNLDTMNIHKIAAACVNHVFVVCNKQPPGSHRQNLHRVWHLSLIPHGTRLLIETRYSRSTLPNRVVAHPYGSAGAKPPSIRSGFSIDFSLIYYNKMLLYWPPSSVSTFLDPNPCCQID